MHCYRKFMLALAALLVGIVCASGSVKAQKASSTAERLAELETEFNGRLGLFALDTGAGSLLVHRADERFPLCSTFKVLLASAILERGKQVPGLLQQRVKFAKNDLVTYSPIAEKRLAEGMLVAELCAAALQHSDNTSANLLMRILGGPAAVTAYARSIGDREFRLDRWETELNSAIPGDPRDTSTPRAMGLSLQRLALGDALDPGLSEQLRAWLLGNTTGAARIRAGVPADWRVGDKTGTGDYGVANDVAVLWPPDRAPVVLAIYTAQREKDAKPRSEILAAATRIVVDWLQGAR